MKTLFVITRADTLGGAQVYVMGLARQMLRDNHKVMVVTGASGPFSQELETYGVPTAACHSLGNAPSPLRDWRTIDELKRIFDKFRPDLVSAHSTKAGILARMAAKSRGIPCVFTAHGWAFNDATAEPMRSIYRWVEKRVEPLSDKIVCVSEFCRQSGIRAGMNSKRLITLHNGIRDIDLSLRADVRPDRPAHIIMVSRLEKPKDPQSVLRAISTISEVHLDIVGDGPMLSACTEMAASLGISERVHMWGRRRDVPNLLAAAQISVLATNSEAFGLSSVEAMRAGLPVVVSDVGGTPETIEDGVSGFLVPRGDVETLRNRLQRLVDDPALRERMGRAARRRYEEHFTFDRMYEKTMAVYEEVVAEHKGRAAVREAAGGRA